MTLNAGEMFGRYRLEARLGEGGLAEVWKAVDTASGQTIALKRFTGALASGDAERLRADVELLAANAMGGHPHVVEVLGGGAEPSPYVVMEYLDGGDLGEELARAGRLSNSRTIDVGKAVASALSAATDAGIIHGDLKPSNILLGSDGAIKLSDFNVARILDYAGASISGTLLLSLSYAATEVWDGKPTPSSDLYALGCVLYECLVGHAPFTGSYTEIIRAHLDKPPNLAALPADTPGDLTSLIADLLEKVPERRPPDADAVSTRLSAIESDLVTGAKLPASFGPWVIDRAHRTEPMAWLAHHEETGEKATVEVLIGDRSLGDVLRKAVAANPKLVPLGAERLLGTNRLMLRPGEGFREPVPKGSWIYWVARDEMPRA
jgi:eukaryotic-like serine/threonine-protein kinase